MRKWPRPWSPALAACMTQLTQTQADYIGVKVDGPYKPDTYKY
jgi:adenosylhomocysteinase